VVICLERGADLHMAQLMPLSLAPVKSRLVLPFWYQLTRVDSDKGPLNGVCVCVCVCARARVRVCVTSFTRHFHYILATDCKSSTGYPGFLA